jgi:multidrug efflux pump subunit AcrA (membrane-fusion protein)
MSKQQKTWIVVGAVLVVIVGAALVFFNLRVQGNTGTAGSTGGSASTSAYQTTTVQRGTLTSSVEGTGTVRSKLSAIINWATNGQVDQVNAKIGDQVKANDLLVTLKQDASLTSLETALLNAQQNLAALTTPEAIANARLAITTAQTNVVNAQAALNNLQYWQNPALVKNYYANYVLAKANLDRAQTAFDNTNGGVYINNANQAAAYNALYTAQQAYNTASYYYSLYSQAPTQNQHDQAQANLDLTNATLKSDQNYLAALTGGTIPAGATGTDLLKLQQAQLAVQTAQKSLDATRLVAPFSGEVAAVAASVGDYVSPGQIILVISDINHMHVETTDLSERDVPKVKLGQAATVTIKALNQAVPGKVAAISPLADNLGGDVVYKVTILLDNLPSNLRSGMSVDVQFNTGP